MAKFDFITDEDFRDSLEADFREMTACMDASAWKAVHVLAGSIIEAVLIDYLVAENHVPRDKALSMDFGTALALCKEKKIISPKTADLSSAVKDYRNLIHPGRIIRLNEHVGRESAEVAKALVGIVLEEIERQKRENYGYTAEQIVAKLRSAPSAHAIISHLLKRTNRTEIERLLLKVLPDAYMNCIEDEFTSSYGPPALEECFRAAFDLASDETKRKTAAQFVRIIKEEGSRVVDTYGTAFFRASDLNYVPADDADLVKQHLLDRIQSSLDARLLTATEGIGTFLAGNEVNKFVDPLVKAMCSSRDASLNEKAHQCLKFERLNTSTEVHKKIIQRLGEWIGFYRSKGKDVYATKLEQIKAEFVASEELPF